jgi:dolichol-phosphate mannosyltransferase
MAPFELALVIPTLNERENVLPLLSALETALAGIEWEAVFVDDDSRDGTAEQIRSIAASDPRVRLLGRVGQRDLSSACVEGMRSTLAPYVAVMDADLQHDERVLRQMLERMKVEVLDVVVGSRTVSGGSMGQFPWSRVLVSRLGATAARLVCHCQLSDAMSGFFIVRRSFFEGISTKLKGTGFKVLLDLLVSSEHTPRIGEVPYTFRKRQRGRSKFGILPAVSFLRFLVSTFRSRGALAVIHLRNSQRSK